MKNNTIISSLVRMSLLLILFSYSRLCQSQSCDPKWNRTKSINCVGSPIQFESNSPGRTTYEWIFENGMSTGQGTTTALRDPVHAFSRAGNYIVIFKGSGGAGPCTDTVMITIYCCNSEESPKIVTKPLNNKYQYFTGNKFCFIDSTLPTQNNNICNVSYQFGDGAVYSNDNPKVGDTICHSFNNHKGGYFDLTVEIRNCTGCRSFVKYDTFMRVYPKSMLNTSISIGEKINFYPNPTNDYLNINLKEPSVIRIYSIVGEILFLQNFKVGLATIDLKNLTKSNYFIEVFDGTNYYRQIVQKQ